MKKLLILTVPLALLSAQEITRDIVIHARPGTAMAAPTVRNALPGSAAVEFLSMEMGSSSVVKNAPYAAEAITETVQTLADGNRIVRKNSVAQYRDGEGRTRREFDLQSLGGLGEMAEGPGKSIMIDDPVSKTNYQLHVKTKTAMKMPRGEGLFTMSATRSGMAASSSDVMVFTNAVPASPIVSGQATPADGGHVTMTRSIVRSTGGPDAAHGKVEDLGSRNIEGVEAKGTRSTMTIAAGKMGNERPIEVVSERWYSEQLKTLVFSKHADPRFGETTLRLTNVRLGEQPALLFEVPADYTVQDAPMKVQQMRKRIDEKRQE